MPICHSILSYSHYFLPSIFLKKFFLTLSFTLKSDGQKENIWYKIKTCLSFHPFLQQLLSASFLPQFIFLFLFSESQREKNKKINEEKR